MLRILRKKKSRIYLILAAVTLLLNLVALNSTAFCDAYIAYVFPMWVNLLGRFSAFFPFSLGEWMIVAGVVFAAAAVLLGIALAGERLWSLWRKGRMEGVSEGQRKAGRLRRLGKRFFSVFAWVVLAVFIVITLGSTILYRGSAFAEKYLPEAREEYSLTDGIRVYNLVAKECNRLSGKMVRDASGRILHSRQTAEAAGAAQEWNLEAYLQEEAIACMQKLGETYPQLDGWYPRPKPMFFSDLMCQMYMCGYYFPFSMEANYNDVMYVMNLPATMCHELSHLRGFILEDEANFIAYLACLQSEDELVRYSGFLSVLYYLKNDLTRARRENPAAWDQAAAEVAPVEILEQVREDNVFVEQEEWDRIHAKALFSTETVDEASDALTDTLLKINGVEDGRISYSRVVRLLLQYYG